MGTRWGAGKSQLVLHYVQKYLQQYQTVFWIEASWKETIERDYVQIYKHIRKLLYPSVSDNNATIPAEDTIETWL